MLSINNLSVAYGGEKVLTDFSLNLADGEIYSLIGPSGCGKTTLLKVLCGIKKDYTGNINYNAVNVDDKSVSVGYVPQNYGLLDWKTVEGNIYLPLKLDKSKKISDDENQDILTSLEINDLLKKYPSELSGGQRQRVALARAFVTRPSLLLMDEPFSALDTFTSSASQELFLRIWSKYKVTTLFITHNIMEAVSVGKHILMMSKTDRKIISQVENIYFEEPENETGKMRLATEVKKMFENSISNG